jgi:hypothetical protein
MYRKDAANTPLKMLIKKLIENLCSFCIRQNAKTIKMKQVSSDIKVILGRILSNMELIFSRWEAITRPKA